NAGPLGRSEYSFIAKQRGVQSRKTGKLPQPPPRRAAAPSLDDASRTSALGSRSVATVIERRAPTKPRSSHRPPAPPVQVPPPPMQLRRCSTITPTYGLPDVRHQMVPPPVPRPQHPAALNN